MAKENNLNWRISESRNNLVVILHDCDEGGGRIEMLVSTRCVYCKCLPPKEFIEFRDTHNRLNGLKKPKLDENGYSEKWQG